jgi:hypothetical protein
MAFDYLRQVGGEIRLGNIIFGDALPRLKDCP